MTGTSKTLPWSLFWGAHVELWENWNGAVEPLVNLGIRDPLKAHARTMVDAFFLLPKLKIKFSSFETVCLQEIDTCQFPLVKKKGEWFTSCTFLPVISAKKTGP